uniref:C-type lectin domain-containing protein n=1 Tax=Branchiostoma floridae TaxID=7739 RepID=C3ZNG7_BRAFL|eukprot:XP_002589909.1 hypothetical protein BRAFLDRAFT_81963 [Branchiostoma floridae]
MIASRVLRKTSIREMSLPASLNSKMPSPSRQDMDSGQMETLKREPTDIGTYSQLPVTGGFVGNQKYGRGALRQGKIEEEDIHGPRQASHQSGHGGQSPAEDTDKTARNGDRRFENTMYAAGVLRQDDGECTILYSETEEQSPGTIESHYYSNIVGNYCVEEDIHGPRQASHQSGHGGQSPAEDTDKTGRNGDRRFENTMYAAGVLRQDDGGRQIKVDENCEDPNSIGFHYLGQMETLKREPTDIGTYSQLPGTGGFVGNQKYGRGALRQGEIQEEDIHGPRQASHQSGHGGQSPAEDTDKTARNGDRRFENTMYAAGVLRQDDGECTILYSETEEQSPGTNEPHYYSDNVDNYCVEEDINDPRQASHQSGHGEQSAAEDTDKMGRDGTCLFKNPMYAAGVLRQDEGGHSVSSCIEEESKEKSPGTDELRENPGNDKDNCIDDAEISNPRQASHQRGHGGRSTAEDTNKIGRNGARMLENPMYVAGVLPQDNGGNNDAPDDRVFPISFNVTSHRVCVILCVTIALVVAVAIVAGVGHGLVTFLATMKETHPIRLNGSLERSGTSNRPVSPFPITPTGSTLGSKNGNLSPVTTEDAAPLPSRKATDDVSMPIVSSTDLDLETRVFPQTGTAKAVSTATTTQMTAGGVTMPTMFFTNLETRVFPQTRTAHVVTPTATANVFTHSVESTGIHQLQNTTKQQLLKTIEGYQLRRGICYKAFYTRKTFIDAAATCRQDGGTLPKPKDAGTNAFLVSLYKFADDINSAIWLALQSQKGRYMWVDGSPLGTFSPWYYWFHLAQAADHKDATNCAVLDKRGEWVDLPCHWERGFICQVKDESYFGLIKQQTPKG